MEEKLKALAENEEFCEKLEQTESAEEAVKLFAEYGVEITEDELKKLLAAVPEGEMDEAALEGVAGGSLKCWWKDVKKYGLIKGSGHHLNEYWEKLIETTRGGY